MSEILWTMALLAVPVLAFGRQGLAHFVQRIGSGGLRFFTIWGWCVAVVLFLMYLGREGQLDFDHGPALFYAVSFMAWFAAAQELGRRKREGGLPSAGQHAMPGSQTTRTPDRPLSFIETLKAQEAQLKESAAAVRPGTPLLPEPPAPRPVILKVDSAPMLRLEPVRSMFAAPAAGAPADPVKAPLPTVTAPAHAAGGAGVPPDSRRRHKQAERRAVEAQIVEVLKRQAAADETATMSRTDPAPLQTDAPYSPPAFTLAGGPERSMRPTPASTFIPSEPPASYVPPAGPVPSVPVTLGGGFNYKPTLVESRLGGSTPDAADGGS